MLVRTGEEIIDLLRGGQGVFNVVPLAGVVGEVDAAILRIDSAHVATDAPRPRTGRRRRRRRGGALRAARLAEGG